MRQLILLIPILFFSHAPKAQQSANSFYDSLNQKVIYLDSIDFDDVYDMAHDYHYWHKFEISELIFDYVLEKNTFRTSISDTTLQLAGRGTYYTLAHLRMLKHKYAEAQNYLDLAQLTPRYQHWCGNAAMAEKAMEEAYAMECKIGLAESHEKPTLWNDFLNLAFSQDGYGSPDYAGRCLINYLRASYSDNEIIYLFRKSRETIVAEKKQYDDYTHIEGTLQILKGTAHFNIYSEEKVASDPAIIKKKCGEWVMNKMFRWFEGY